MTGGNLGIRHVVAPDPGRQPLRRPGKRLDPVAHYSGVEGEAAHGVALHRLGLATGGQRPLIDSTIKII